MNRVSVKLKRGERRRQRRTKCPICQQIFMSFPSMKLHKKGHRKPRPVARVKESSDGKQED